MTTADNRLLTAEQLDCDLQAVYHLGVAYQGGDAMRRIERHIAALTEQITAYKSGHDDDSAMIHMQEEEEEKIITMANHIAAQAEQREAKVWALRYAADELEAELGDGTAVPPGYPHEEARRVALQEVINELRGRLRRFAR